MDIRYYADTDLKTRQPDGLFRVVLDTAASWVENLTHDGWVHDDNRAGDVEEYGVRPVNEQSALLIAQKVFGQQQLDDPVNPFTHPEASEPAPDAETPADDQAEGGDQGGGKPKPTPAPPAGTSGPGGS